MVHADQVGAGGEGHPLGRRHAHEERAHQPRPHGHRHAADVGEADTRLAERLLHQRVERLHVRASGHLGHDATEAFVQVDLGGDEVRAQLEAVFDHGDGGLVARRLDAQRDHEGRTISGRLAAIEARRRR